MNNLPTIIIAVIIGAAFIAVVANGIRNKKKGKNSCSCGCNGCSMADICRKNMKE